MHSNQEYPLFSAPQRGQIATLLRRGPVRSRGFHLLQRGLDGCHRWFDLFATLSYLKVLECIISIAFTRL